MPRRIKVGDRVKALRNSFQFTPGTLGTVKEITGGNGHFYFEVDWDDNPKRDSDPLWPMTASEIEVAE